MASHLCVLIVMLEILYHTVFSVGACIYIYCVCMCMNTCLRVYICYSLLSDYFPWREVLIRFQDVAFLRPRASFFAPHFVRCGRCECLEIATCLKAVVGESKDILPVKMLFLQQSLFSCQLNFMENIRLT